MPGYAGYTIGYVTLIKETTAVRYALCDQPPPCMAFSVTGLHGIIHAFTSYYQ